MSDPIGLRHACLDAAIHHYPKGTTYVVQRGQSWDAAAFQARRKEIEPLVDAILEIVARAAPTEDAPNE